MYIFDRWGTEIYHSNNLSNGWNGAVHGTGSICQEDTYIYKITLTDAAGIQHAYIGNVNLLK
jgi:gliding motility-associated-like protein